MRVRKVLSAVQIGFDAVDVDQDNRGIEFMNLGHRRPGSLSRQRLFELLRRRVCA